MIVTVRRALLLPLLALAPLAAATAQQGKPLQFDDPMTSQLVDSRRGFVMRLPAEAVLDSSRSGWNPKGRYEQRIYRIGEAGTIRIVATVAPTTIPDDATADGAYVYLAADSATARGTAAVRTYLLPTRSVRIELLPDGVHMRPYLDAAPKIFGSFRWKAGANTDLLDTDEPPQGLPTPPPTESLGG